MLWRALSPTLLVLRRGHPAETDKWRLQEAAACLRGARSAVGLWVTTLINTRLHILILRSPRDVQQNCWQEAGKKR